MFAGFVSVYALPVVFAARRVHSAALDLPQGPSGLYWFKLGFLIVCVLAIAALALFSNSPNRRLRKNTPKHDRPIRSNTNELGSGDFATKGQIQKWLQPHNDLDTLLPVRGIKASDGIALKQGSLIIPSEERNRHMLIVAKTGSGKTTRAILPILFSDCLCPKRSTIVLDSKPEMWDKLVGLTRKHNPEKEILLFNPLDTIRSLSWNILAKIETDTDAKLIANTIISATDNPNSRADTPFFRNNALALLNSIMVGLLSGNDEKLSMPRVHELVNSGMENLCRWLEVRPAAIRNSKTFVDLARSGSQNADTILSELGMRLAAWDLRDIRATTAFDELNLETLIEKPTLFIVELRESELEMLRPMANVIVVEILRYLTKRAEQMPSQTLPRPVSIVIDEFASALGRLPDIHVKLNTLRSRNVSFVGAIQSIAQIKANYDRDADSVLAGFSTKVFMPSLDFQDAEWASKETGTMTVRFNVSSVGKNKRLIDIFATKNDNLQEQVQQRPVLTPDEIGRPVDNIATFFMPNTPVFQGHLVPYYEVPEMSDLFSDGKSQAFNLRTAPIEYDDRYVPPSTPQSGGPQGGGGSSGGGAPGLSPEQIAQQIPALKEALGWADLLPDSKQWWQSLEAANPNNQSAVYNLLEQLRRRNITGNEFYSIYASSGVSNLDDLFAIIDQRVLAEMKSVLEISHASEQAKDWWKAFEDANKANTVTVIELCQELIKRGVTIESFFGAYIHSEASSIPAILQVLDEMIRNGKIGLKTHGRQTAETSPSSTPPPAAAPPPSEFVSTDENRVEYSSPVPSPQPERVEPAPQKPSSSSSYLAESQQAKNAVRTIYVQTYFEMGIDQLTQNNRADFEKLLKLASEDPHFPKELLGELADLPNNLPPKDPDKKRSEG